jgi:hypothetical protein
MDPAVEEEEEAKGGRLDVGQLFKLGCAGLPPPSVDATCNLDMVADDRA